MKYTEAQSAKELVAHHLICKTYAGSHAYGTAVATSDIDFRGIFYADAVNIVSPFFKVEEVAQEDEEDTKFYELSKFIKLYLDCNPNIVELLWVDESSIVYTSEIYNTLRQHRYDLLSAKVAFTFSGYALAQLKRIRGHHKWINNPKPVNPPKQIDYISMVHNFTAQKKFKINLMDYQNGYVLIPYDANLYGVYKRKGQQTFADDFTLNALHNLEDYRYFDEQQFRMPLFIIKFNKEQYRQDNDDWKNYWYWKNHRNEKRSALEQVYGFDTKHAMHLIRLLRMGVEILRDGIVNVKRPDAEELLFIRNGGWTYNEITAYADELDLEIRNHWYKKTQLPKVPNIKLAAKIIIDIYNNLWE